VKYRPFALCSERRKRQGGREEQEEQEKKENKNESMPVCWRRLTKLALHSRQQLSNGSFVHITQ